MKLKVSKNNGYSQKITNLRGTEWFFCEDLNTDSPVKFR